MDQEKVEYMEELQLPEGSILKAGDQALVPRKNGEQELGVFSGKIDLQYGMPIFFLDPVSVPVNELERLNGSRARYDLGDYIETPTGGAYVGGIDDQGNMLAYRSEKAVPLNMIFIPGTSGTNEIPDLQRVTVSHAVEQNMSAVMPNNSEILPNKDVVAIGDSNGDFEQYNYNMEQTGLVGKNWRRKLKWTGGNKHAIVLGDILADRAADGFKILLENSKLRKQAHKHGGDITVIAGNHDAWMISFLLNRRANDTSPLSNAMIDEQGIGMKELTRYSGDRKETANLMDAITRKRLNRTEILNNMQQDAEGHLILEEICRMKLVEVIGDTLFIHTDPTDEILSRIFNESVHGGIKAGAENINRTFQGELENCLLNGQTFNTGGKCHELMDIFLNTENRTFYQHRQEYDLSEIVLDSLRKRFGIKRVVFGHSNLGTGYRKQNLHGIEFVNADRGRRKKDISAATISSNGDVSTPTEWHRN